MTKIQGDKDHIQFLSDFKQERCEHKDTEEDEMICVVSLFWFGFGVSNLLFGISSSFDRVSHSPSLPLTLAI